MIKILLATLVSPRRWGAVMLSAFLLGGGWIWLSAVSPADLRGESAASPTAGFEAPDFTLETLSGEQITLSDLRGQVVMINLWASWCLPCRAEMPAIDQVYRAWQDQGFVVLAVNSTHQDDEAAAAAFVAEYELTFPILLDRDGSVSRLYRLQALPTTFFVDQDGMIREVLPGGNMTASLIESKITPLLPGLERP